jgi:ABC-type uncharacterized transport system substrate-binding protein
VDMLFVGNTGGIVNWDAAAAAAHAVSNTKIPTGGTLDFVAGYTLITYAKIAEEQGDWAARTALKVLDGTSPADIPIARNKGGMLIINTKIAAASGFNIPYSTIQAADKVIE